MRSALRAMERAGAVTCGDERPSRPGDRAGAARRSDPKLGGLIAAGKFVTMVEIVPPKGINCAKELEGARMLAQNGVHSDQRAGFAACLARA